MLRITVRTGSNEVGLVLEGDLTGAWVTELEDSWRSARSILDGRSFCVDLSAVDRVDQAGRYLLVLLRLDGARFIASGAAMTDLVRTLSGDWPHEQ
jgi:ABC-type transporter Mla MlaB component